MKKLINGVDQVVDEMLDGMIKAYPQYLKRLDGFDVVVKVANKIVSNSKNSKVIGEVLNNFL